MKRARASMAAKLNLPGLVGQTFAAMEIAEEEIARAHLTKAESSKAFGAMCPTEPIRGKALELYRAHAKELVSRVKAGADLRPATDAELLAVFSDTSLIAPTGQNGAAAFEALWARVFPRAKIGGEPAGREHWKGAVDEVIETARRKYTVETRGRE